MIEDNLSKIGLSPSEIKVYLFLVKHGCSYANEISSKTKLNRTNVYEALDRLVGKGFISFIVRNKVKWFEANEPKKIVNYINEKEESLRRNKESLLKELSGLSKSKKSLEANVFVGKKGLRMLFEEILDVGKPISIMAAELQFKKIFGSYFELWHKMRAKKGIRQRSIFPRKFKNKVDAHKLLSYKFVDDKFTNPTTTILYGDNCLFIQWTTETIAIKIKSKEIVRSHQNYFNLLWN